MNRAYWDCLVNNGYSRNRAYIIILQRVSWHYYIFINAEDSLDNLIRQNVITLGVLTDGKDMADQNQSSAYVPTDRQLWTNQSDEDCFASRWLMLFESVSCVHKTWICPFLFGFIQQFYFIFLHFGNEINTGIFPEADPSEN